MIRTIIKSLTILMIIAQSLYPTLIFAQKKATSADKNQVKEASLLPPENNNKILKKDSLLNDLTLLEKALTEMHPGLYRYNSADQIKQLFRNLKTSLPDSIAEGEFMIRLAQTIVKIKCGHTYLNPWNQDKKVRDRLFQGKTFIPIGFKIIDKQFILTENASDTPQLQRGAEILAINGISTEEIYTRLKTIAKTDGNNQSSIEDYLSLEYYKPRNWNAFDIYFPLFYPLRSDTFQLTFKNFGKEKVHKISIPAMTKKERAEKMEAKYGSEILEKEKWDLKIVSKDLAVLKLGTFAIWNWKDFNHQKWYQKAFQKLDSLDIKRLAIDIRGNGGGLSEPANELISYLIEDTLKCEDQGKVFIRTTKFNPELLPYINTWVEVLKEGLPSNLYRSSSTELYELLVPSDCKDIAPKQKRFKGEAFILGGPSNVSATYRLLDKANRFKFANFIGEKSGGNLQGINGGEYAFFTMPYCKMEVDIPLKYFAPYSPQPDTGVTPNVFIKYTQKDIARSRDPFIEYLLKK